MTLVLLIPGLTKATDFEWTWNPKYMGEIHAGYKTTTFLYGKDWYTGSAMLGTLQGVSINKYLSVALGIDANMLTHYYKGQGLRFKMNTYVDMRAYYPVTNIFSVFLDLGLGATFDVKPSPNEASFFCEFGPGVKYKNWGLSFGLQNHGTGKGTSSFFVKAGYYF